MTDIRIANYTLMTVLFIVMTTFCISISTMNQNYIYESNSTILSGYHK